MISSLYTYIKSEEYQMIQILWFAIRFVKSFKPDEMGVRTK